MSEQPPPPPTGPPSYPPPAGPPPTHPPPSYPPPGAPWGPTAGDASPLWAAPARRRRWVPLAVAGVLAVGVLATAVTLPFVVAEDEPPRDLAAVRTYDQLPTTHLGPGESTTYRTSPAVGGPHSPVWLDCGAYDEVLPEVNVVHDLEHGTVWITYRPDGPDAVGAAGVRRLTALLPDNGILSQYPGQDAPVVITVWGRQLALTGPDDPRIPLFIDAYGAGQTAPEPLASCRGGADPDDLPGSGRVQAAPAPGASRPTTPPEESP